MANFFAVYRLLFALSLILINPWGSDRGEIWTQPKVLVIQLITALNLWIVLRSLAKGSLSLPFAWKVGLCLWSLFLAVGLTATLSSPFPLCSLWGQSTLGDGWAYWGLLAVFVLSNALLLRLEPRLLGSQLDGLLAGGVILALSMIPQVFDWHIDYTATSGQVRLFHPQKLVSTIWQSHMPIGLYSNRGHLSFVLAAVALLALIRGGSRLQILVAMALYLLISTALFFTQTQAGVVGLLIATLYLLLRLDVDSERWRIVLSHRMQLFWIGCLLFAGYLLLQVSTMLPLMEPQQLSMNLQQFATGRLHLWELAVKGIMQRPLLGWGFDGFGIAYPFVADWAGEHQGYLLDKVAVNQVLRLNDFTFDYLGTDGKLHIGLIMTYKAHNLFLDTALSVGMLGLLFYLLLLGFSLWCAAKIGWGVEAVAIAYLIYTLTWYESAQFSHLAWWALSVGLDSPKRLPPPKQGHT